MNETTVKLRIINTSVRLRKWGHSSGGCLSGKAALSTQVEYSSSGLPKEAYANSSLDGSVSMVQKKDLVSTVEEEIGVVENERR
ncbi:unnamed protein product [Cochlearia groenlandica]